MLEQQIVQTTTGHANGLRCVQYTDVCGGWCVVAGIQAVAGFFMGKLVILYTTNAIGIADHLRIHHVRRRFDIVAFLDTF
jgi:hypothetical protein